MECVRCDDAEAETDHTQEAKGPLELLFIAKILKTHIFCSCRLEDLLIILFNDRHGDGRHRIRLSCKISRELGHSTNRFQMK